MEGWAFGPAVKVLMKTSVSHIGVSGFNTAFCISAFCSYRCWEAMVMAQAVGFLLPQWETWLEF